MKLRSSLFFCKPMLPALLLCCKASFAQVLPLVSISAQPTGVLCDSTPVTLTAVYTNGGNSPAFQWKHNGVAVGGNTPTYSTATLKYRDSITVTLTSSDPAASPATVTSAAYRPNMMPNITPEITITPSQPGPYLPNSRVGFNISYNDPNLLLYPYSVEFYRNCARMTGEPFNSITDPLEGDEIYAVLKPTWTCLRKPVDTSNVVKLSLTTASNPIWTSMCFSSTPRRRSNGAEWTGANGDLWLFGGFDVSSTSGQPEVMNDLMRYNMATKQWRIMKGTAAANAPSVYGTQGIGAAANTPGARENSLSWMDNQGNYWLYGGRAVPKIMLTDSVFNDLWKYTVATNEWTWIGGDSVVNREAVMGTPGVPSIVNHPGARYGAATWTDSNGDFWLFAGRGRSAGNDLWKYSPLTNEWTFIKGDTAGNATAVYGTQGVSASDNQPAASSNIVSWTDDAGKFWLFVGNATLWKFDPATNMWVWMKGDPAGTVPGRYGTLGIPHNNNNPGSRSGSVGWKGKDGRLWLYGGDGYGNNARGWLNDLWYYDIAWNQWVWQRGDSSVNNFAVPIPGNFSGVTCGVPSEKYLPGGFFDAMAWTTPDGSFWMFGGYGRGATSTGYRLEMWQATGNCSQIPSVIHAANGITICAGETKKLAVHSGTYYQWAVNGSNIPGANGPVYYATQAGNYTVTIYNGMCIRTAQTTLTALPIVPVDVSLSASANPAVAGNTVTFTAAPTNGGNNPRYEWRKNGKIVLGFSATSTYVTNELAQGDMITVVLESNAPCAGPGAPCGNNTTDSASVTMNVLQRVTPTVSITSNAGGPVCPGAAVTFTATATNTGSNPVYQWKKNGANVGTNAATYTANNFIHGDQVSVTLTSSAINASPATVSSNVITVTVNSITGNITPADVTICEGSSQLLTASGGTTYQWYRNGSIINGATTAGYIAQVSGIYSVQISSGECSSMAGNTATVTVHTVPIVDFTINPGTACAGSTTTLTATGADAYAWTGPFLSSTSGSTVNALMPNAGTYTFQLVGSRNSCNDTLQKNIQVHAVPATPSIMASGSTTFCSGNNVTLSSTAASGNQWFLNGSAISGATANSLLVINAGSYWVVATQNGCSSGTSSTIGVTVHATPPKPTITATGNMLTSSAAAGNQWYLNGTPLIGATNQQYAVQSAGQYSVQVTQNNCTASSELFHFVATGINAPDLDQQIIVAPNPVRSSLTIKYSGNAARFDFLLYDITGRHILAKGSFTASYVLNMQGYAPGVYIIRIMNQRTKEQVIRKLVRQ